MQSRPARVARPEPSRPDGGFTVLDGDTCYRIAAVHRMRPFLISLASDTDLWMFVTSGGGLTAGRVDADGALFPYRTVDQLHDAHHHTGPLTLIRPADHDHGIWQPFGTAEAEHPAAERNLLKNTLGNRLVFEEINHDLQLAFRHRWAGCDEFGWVRTATLENRGPRPVSVDVLDGLRNVLPWGAPLRLYQQSSNLVNAYKKNEVDPATGLGMYSLTAGITDRAETLEVLRANVVWCCGLDDHRHHLSDDAVTSFRRGQPMATETLRNGGRGHYLVSCRLDLAPGQAVTWHMVGDTGCDHAQVADLQTRLRDPDQLAGQIAAGLDRASANLRRNVASADGLQLTGRPEAWAHHQANVLFNNMRGGVFDRNHDVPMADILDFLQTRNRDVAARHAELLASWPDTMPVRAFLDQAIASGDPDLARLAHEYLPLYFGRRHGDPSRPWNQFAIRMRDSNGKRVLDYQGNWRDIFQNWEALAVAFPGFLPSMVARFVNASTVDGFNPYRITRDGVDWEIIDPQDSWSNIGYWGDHQIVYLLRLLEMLQRHDPDALGDRLGLAIFSFADVPYRLAPYADILHDPSNTITFDDAHDQHIAERVARHGTDGKLVAGPDGTVRHANLLEKLLVPVLSKLSCFIPDAGIWMITQRPEWNDANNALAGGGVSVVTLCYLRRYLGFLADMLDAAPDDALPVASEVVDWFERLAAILDAERAVLTAPARTPGDRKRVMDALGEAFGHYRATVEAHGLTDTRPLHPADVARFCRDAQAAIDPSVATNRRDDGLFHTYNLPAFTPAGVEVHRLAVMLEGQVAAISSGAVSAADGLDLLEQLFASPLYRADQRSFLLYPVVDRPGFLERNRIEPADVAAIPLLGDLIAAGHRGLVVDDVDGIAHFQADLRNADDVAAVLDDLADDDTLAPAVARDRDAVLALYESIFHHRAYTGRSGVMYGYEGLGCIYWHMVAKLLLAVQELLHQADADPGTDPAVREGLAAMYFRIRAGIGYERTVAEYGAFPTDPYSHTPPDGGARQPGMTGQVKEEILTRFGELGVHVEDGVVRFAPTLLQADEFLAEAATFEAVDLDGQARTLALPPDSLAFTLCQVPVIYRRHEGAPSVTVRFADGTHAERDDNRLTPAEAAALFARGGGIDRIEVTVPPTGIRPR